MTREELFDQMIMEDGRHRLLFDQWQDGKITKEAFEQGEAEIMDDVMKKMNVLTCRNCHQLAS